MTDYELRRRYRMERALDAAHGAARVHELLYVKTNEAFGKCAAALLVLRQEGFSERAKHLAKDALACAQETERKKTKLWTELRTIKQKANLYF